MLCQSLLTDDQVSSAPILVLGNKIDRPGAASEEEVMTYFNLHGQTTGKVRLCEIAMHVYKELASETSSLRLVMRIVLLEL